jgi:hypothetical protein
MHTKLNIYDAMARSLLPRLRLRSGQDEREAGGTTGFILFLCRHLSEQVTRPILLHAFV